MSDVKYPDIEVELDDSHAVAIMMKVKRAMHRAKVPPEEIEAYMKEAKSGDYDHLLATTMKWVNVS